jgi:membrane fusion protein, multidrug efflux system
MEKNKIHIYLYNALIVLCLLGGAVYVVSQFMHFGSGELASSTCFCCVFTSV